MKGDTERDETELRDSWLQNPVRNWTTERILEWASEIGVQSCLEGIQKFKLTGRVCLLLLFLSFVLSKTFFFSFVAYTLALKL